MKMKRASLLLIAAICTGTAAAGTLVEPLVGVLAPILEREIDVPGAMTGQFISVMFLSSAVFVLPAGFLADRVRPVHLALGQLILAFIGFGIFTFADTAAWIFAGTLFGGLAMGMMMPLSNRIIINYLPHRQHATAVGWRSLGPQIGVVFIGSLFAVTGEFVFWRHTVLFVTVLIVVFAIFVMTTLSRRSTVEHDDEPAESSRTQLAPTEQIARPIVWWLMPYMFFSNGVISCVSAYMIYYAFNEIELPLAVASVSAATVSGVSIAARLIWVKLMTPANAIRLMFTANMVTGSAALLLVFAGDMPVFFFWLAVVAIGAFGVGASPMPQVLLVWNTNGKYIGRVSSFNGLSASSGMTLQPLLMSVVVASVGVAQSWIVLSVCAFLGGATLLAYRVFNRRSSEKSRFAETS